MKQSPGMSPVAPKCNHTKVLRIPNFYQILIHLLVGELSHGEVSDP